MEDKKISSDLEDDAELEALRLAALATLKKRSNKVNEPDPSTISQIQPINSITRSIDNSSDQGSHKNQLSWRNNVQAIRKRGRPFPKSNQRSSNLIVITPVGVEKEKPQRENRGAPQLLLPQHRWCQQVNEDSSSPRTDRHTGPTRFNRRGSGSESSDSDYDESGDSYSNDTVLQDEHSLLSLAETNNNEEKLENGSNSDRRLSFEDFESKQAPDDEKNEATSVYNSLKTSYSHNETEASQNNKDSYLTQKPNVSDTSYFNPNQKDDAQSSRISSPKDDKPSSGVTDSIAKKNGESNTVRSSKTLQPKSKHTPITFDASDSMGLEKSKRSADAKEKSSQVFKDLRNHNNAHKSLENSKLKTASLSRNDLRYELKRKKEVSVKLVSPKKSKTDAEHQINKRGRSWSRERSVSRERKSYKHSRSPSYSPKRRRRRHNKNWHSSSQSSHSSSSSSSSSETSRSSSPVINRSVSSVVQPVQSKIVVTEPQNNTKLSINQKSHLSSSGTEFFSVKKVKGIEIKLNPRPNFQISVLGKDSQNNSTEVKKRGPVHMRLGTLPRKRIIQMPKAVEAAFVSTSSDDDADVNNKCKKSNINLVTDLSDKIVSRYSENELTQRSDVPKADRGKFFR